MRPRSESKPDAATRWQRRRGSTRSRAQPRAERRASASMEKIFHALALIDGAHDDVYCMASEIEIEEKRDAEKAVRQ